MVYSQKFVMSILVNGKIQKEYSDGSVDIPFGSEYSLKLRNKNSKRAVCKLFIDGEEQSCNGYVIQPHSFVIIERNSHIARKLKFVDQGSLEAQDHGKDASNHARKNGVVEARFYLERDLKPVEHHYYPIYQPPVIIEKHHHHYPQPYITYPVPMPTITGGGGSYATMGGGTSCSMGTSGINLNTVSHHTMSFNAAASQSTVECCCSSPQPRQKIERPILHREVKPGVTVEGSHSNQTFRKVDIEIEDHFVSVKLILKGYYGEKVEVSAYCSNCGARKTSESANFCSICGRKLVE